MLRGLAVDRPNQVWAMYVPMARGFIYLAAVMDWFSRRVLSVANVDHDGGGILRPPNSVQTTAATSHSRLRAGRVWVISPPFQP